MKVHGLDKQLEESDTHLKVAFEVFANPAGEERKIITTQKGDGISRNLQAQ